MFDLIALQASETPITVELVQGVFLGALSGVLYGAVWFARKNNKSGEDFNREKFLGSVILAALIGASLTLGGVPVTVENIDAGIAANIALLAVIEPMVKSALYQLDVARGYSG